MNQLDAMQVFVRVAELGSFTQAADSLGQPKASISTSVKQLESLLGTRLLHRTTRKVQMTQDGLAYYERSKDLLADMEELQTLFVRDDAEISGRLRVDMPSGLAKNIVIPQLPDFLQLHPRLELELSSTDRRVDLIREGFDCVIRVGTLVDSSLIARPLGFLGMVNCASPAYLHRYGVPQTLEDLAAHRLVHYVPTLGAKPGGFEYQDAELEQSIPMAGALAVNNTDAYQAACLAGLGIVQVPEIGVRDLIAQGRLVSLLESHVAAPMPVSLLYANRRHLSKRSQSFMDWIAGVMRDVVV